MSPAGVEPVRGSTPKSEMALKYVSKSSKVFLNLKVPVLGFEAPSKPAQPSTEKESTLAEMNLPRSKTLT